MQRSHSSTRPGLILLVVLGMLALFSMLAVTYVVFASQSRATSVSLSRKDIRSTRTKPLFEEAIKELIRGTTNTSSSLYGHDLLGDVYGDAETLLMSTVTIRDFQITSGGPTAMTYDATGGLQRPMLLGGDFVGGAYTPGHFLRIPIGVLNGTGQVVDNNNNPLPQANDILTGRIVTFMPGNGPLGGQSFRVVRYVGAVTSGTAIDVAQAYSITIDLSDGDLSGQYTRLEGTAPLTKSIAEWMVQIPPVTNTGIWAAGLYACYDGIDYNPQSRLLNRGYQLFFNAAPLNTHGVGVYNDGSSQVHQISTTPPLANSPLINLSPVGLQTRYQDLLDNTKGRLVDPTGAVASSIAGDTDEPYDAADFQNMFLAYRESGATTSEAIIPSFHRAALINYIINWKAPASYTEVEFLATLRRIELAAGRPLSIDITTPAGQYVTHGSFTGGNTSPAAQLKFQVTGNWSNWPAQGLPNFISWLDYLTRGPWDVDNDADGVMDSVWVETNLPLQTSADGKLLKAMVAYYVDDLDSRIDVNATGSAAQANLATSLFGQPSPRPLNNAPPTNVTPPIAFARGHNAYFSQGQGYGPADISFRHLMAKPGLSWGGASGQDYAENAYRNVMFNRYRRNPLFGSEFSPGDLNDDPLSILNMREQRLRYRHGSLPGLPVAIHGRDSIELDRLGNPFIWNADTIADESLNDPYESRLIAPAHQDSPFNLAEWERIYRVGDSDRSALPSRLQEVFGESSTTISQSSLGREITPISRHLRVPSLASRGLSPVESSPVSFFHMVNTVRNLKSQTPVPQAAFGSLFPLEFNRGLALNINRPFGNGIDDDNDGAIDEPTEVGSGQVARTVTSSGAPYTTPPIAEDYFAGNDPLNLSLDPQVNNTIPAIFRGQETRQMFARHLYCLAHLIFPQDYLFPNIEREYWQALIRLRDNSMAPPADREAARVKIVQIRGRVLAQWAVNVVDYRDSDLVITRFPYDADPFRDDTGADNFVWTPDDGVAWGLERPELLFTESLALHDIRVRKDAMANPARFDQYRMPEGSLFLELYCPRVTETGANSGDSKQLPGVDGSLYTTNGSGDVVLDVSRLTPAITGQERFPVWRVYVSEAFQKPAPASPPVPATPYERLINNVTGARTATEATRFDLTYQLPSSNLSYVTAPTDWRNVEIPALRTSSGLVFDMATVATSRLPDPDPEQARVILFTPSSAQFSPTVANTPGVEDADSQVFFNRTGDIQLHGNQYLVVGPRDVTYLGSRTAASAAAPDNAPSRHRIELQTDWAEMTKADGTVAPGPNTGRATVKPAVTMVAGAEPPPMLWSSTATPPTVDFIGVNVSEPLPNDADYYEQPTARLNASDMSADAAAPTGTGAPGFANLPADAYNDYQANSTAPAKAPFDNATKGPLRFWDLDLDGTPNTLSAANNVVEPGTAVDWCTAYLQRLADPDKPWHATLNPYITVDWIPIDLTVFSGEDNNTDLAGQIPKLASRQKVGQTAIAQAIAFNTTGSGSVGQTFLSALTIPPSNSTVSATATDTFMQYELLLDEGQALSPRPTPLGSTSTFATLGFLNSSFVLAAESGIANLPAMPPVYTGSPGDPLLANANWRPDNLFWANRQFISPYELGYVPVSSPGQLMQEFSGEAPSTTTSRYEAAFVKRVAGQLQLPDDPRMPTAPVTAEITQAQLPDPFDIAVQGTDWPAGSTRPPHVNPANAVAAYPFSHLLNFFQEMPELPTPSPLSTGLDRFTKRHPKDASLALLMDWVETPSPWNDATYVEHPAHFALRNSSAFASELQPLVESNNRVFAPLRAPYNSISQFVEPGRININTLREENVFQGLWSNRLQPSDVDFPPYAPGRAFGGPEDIDHNSNGVFDGVVGRAALGQATFQWTSIFQSRRGYIPMTGFIPTVTRLNPHYPTEFAGIFKPASEAGMVPRTRNPVPPPAAVTTEAEVQQMEYHRLAREHGVLDTYARQVPAQATLMRAALDTSHVALSSLGIPRLGTQPLIMDATNLRSNAMTDLYPINRLRNLVTERSNAFAVYVTIGFFEYTPAAGSTPAQIGQEYGVDKGEAKRYKAFYVIDRTVPVGYRVGEDHNIEKTILLRRYFDE